MGKRIAARQYEHERQTVFSGLLTLSAAMGNASIPERAVFVLGVKMPELGTQLQFNGILHKLRQRQDGMFFYMTTKWEREQLAPPFGKGIFIGYRVLMEGVTEIETEYGEYGSILSQSKIFTPSNRFVAWLIVPHIRANPVFALPIDTVVF